MAGVGEEDCNKQASGFEMMFSVTVNVLKLPHYVNRAAHTRDSTDAWVCKL